MHNCSHTYSKPITTTTILIYSINNRHIHIQLLFLTSFSWLWFQSIPIPLFAMNSSCCQTYSAIAAQTHILINSGHKRFDQTTNKIIDRYFMYLQCKFRKTKCEIFKQVGIVKGGGSNFQGFQCIPLIFCMDVSGKQYIN